MIKPAHELTTYIDNILSTVDLQKIANQLIDDGQAGMTFTSDELLILEVIINNSLYSHAFTGNQFNGAALTGGQRKSMILELKRAGIPLSSSTFGLLGEQIRKALKNAVDKRKPEIDANIAEIDNNQSLQLDDYKKLTFGSAINTVTAVADVLSLGGSTAPKIVLKVPEISGKLTKVVSLSAKATPLMKKAIKLSQTKTFIFLKVLIEANFAITDETKELIETDEATADMIKSVIGAVGQLTNEAITDRIQSR